MTKTCLSVQALNMSAGLCTSRFSDTQTLHTCDERRTGVGTRLNTHTWQRRARGGGPRDQRRHRTSADPGVLSPEREDYPADANRAPIRFPRRARLYL